MTGFLLVCISMLIKNYIIILFFDTTLEMRESRKSKGFIFYLLAISIFFEVVYAFIAPPPLISMAFSILIYASFLLFYRDKISSKLIYLVILIVLIMIAELLSGLFLYAFNIPAEIFGTPAIYGFIQVMLTNLLLFLFVFLIRHLKNRKFKVRKNLLFMIFPVTSAIILYSVYYIMFVGLSVRYNYGIFAVITVLLVISNFVVIFLVNNHIKNELASQRLTFLEQYIDMNEHHQKDLIELQNNIRRIRHDMNADLTHLSGLLQANRYVDCQALLNQLTERSADLDRMISTCYDGLDAVLSSKMLKAKGKDISVVPNIILPDKAMLQIDEIDLSIICANILDNAIEATEQCPSPQNSIDFEIRWNGASSSLVICSQNPTIRDHTSGKTTKSDSENHGFGLENIRSIAQKWHGMMQYDIKDHVFTIIVSLQNNALTSHND